MKSKILSLAIIIAITIIALYCVLSGPETIILHWNIGGEAESYGSKYLILALPVISFIVFLLIVNQEKHPYDTSLMSEKSRRNRNPKALRDIMPILLLAILYITACSAQIISMSSLVPFSLIIIAIILFSHPLKTIFQHKACTDKLYADSFYKVQKNSHSSFEVICCRR